MSSCQRHPRFISTYRFHQACRAGAYLSGQPRIRCLIGEEPTGGRDDPWPLALYAEGAGASLGQGGQYLSVLYTTPPGRKPDRRLGRQQRLLLAASWDLRRSVPAVLAFERRRSAARDQVPWI